MLNGKIIVVVMPAYNAENTVEKTYSEIPFEIVDDMILVDEASYDRTSEIALRIGIKTIIHEKNLGYGGNQKSCYRAALELGADIVIMVHPDYQYTPRLIPAMAAMIAYGEFDTVLASRILGIGALRGACRYTNTLPTDSLPWSRTCCWVTSCRNTTPGTGLFPGRSWSACRSRRTPTTLSSTTRC